VGSKEHIKKLERMLEKKSTPAYAKEMARQSIRYHEDLSKMEEEEKKR